MSIAIDSGKSLLDSAENEQRLYGDLRWFYIPKPLTRPRLRLYCFPYAAGSPAMFRDWAALLPESVEIRAITLPGRGVRMGERPVCDLKAISRDIAKAVASCSDTHFAFFGHSMGALLAFETARELRRSGTMQPVHLFLSACCAAHRFCEGRIRVENMTDEEFIRHLGRLAGTPPEMLHDRQLMEALLPTLKADFIALDRWRLVPERPLVIPITAIAGREDPQVRPEGVREWRQHTSLEFNFNTLAGDHFFVETARESLVELILRTLSSDAWF